MVNKLVPGYEICLAQGHPNMTVVTADQTLTSEFKSPVLTT